MRKIKDLIFADRFASILTFCFLIVGGFAMINHEMWRDEIQAWLISRDSTGLIDLLRHMKYEGHPPLWHILLMPITRLTRNPRAMQILHLVIAATTVYLTARFSPFDRLQKIVVAFGYFSIYEYAIIARNYAIGFLLIVIFCILFCEKRSKFGWIGGVLFLLAHTSVHALIIVICVGFWIAIDLLFRRKSCGIEKRQLVFGFGLIAIGIITSVLQLNPPADTGFAVGWKTDFDLESVKNVVKLITRALLPIPESKMKFWGSHALGKFEVYRKWQLHISIFLPIIFAINLIRKPTILIIYASSTIGLLTFFYVKYFGSIRHHGFLFLTLFLAMWLSFRSEARIFRSLDRFGIIWEKLTNVIFTLILIAHVIGGFTAIKMDGDHIFSNAKRTANFLEKNGFDQFPIIADKDSATSAVLGHLENVDQFYYVHGHRFGSFVRWDNKRTHGTSPAMVIEDAKNFERDRVLILTSFQIPEDLLKKDQITFIEKFVGSTIGDERFFIHLLESFSR